MDHADPNLEEAQFRLRVEMESEFEEFVSMAAHNMREPLREVAAFSQLLAEDHAGVLDSEARGYLDCIRRGAANAQSVLAAVVDYWAVAAGGREPGPTDMEAALCQALLCANQQIAASQAAVTHDVLPSVTGDFEFLTKVLHHLIANAIAYGDPAAPRVHISSKEVQTGWQFSVRDNGRGIEAAFQDRIFAPFKRLHGREYPGNGLGLSFCRKAVESLGGVLWVESAVGSGSTFYFTVPAV